MTMRSPLSACVSILVLFMAFGACGDDEAGTGTNTPIDSGTEDSGRQDTTSADSGAGDTNPRDTQPPDLGAPDTGPADTGTVDTASEDTAVSDAADGSAGDDAAVDVSDQGTDAATDQGSDVIADQGDAAVDQGDAAVDQGDAAVDQGDAAVDQGFDAFELPETPMLSATVLVDGATVTVVGATLDGSSKATLGAEEQTVSFDAGTLTIGPIDAGGVWGDATLTVTTTGDDATFEVVAVHLMINEIDADTPRSDRHSFVEVSVNVQAEVDLTGFSVVLLQGNSDLVPIHVDDDAGRAAFALGTTNEDGLFVIGSSNLFNTPQITWEGDIEQGAYAAAIYQRTVFPEDFSGTDLEGLIDAVVWGRSTDDVRTQLEDLMDDCETCDVLALIGDNGSARVTSSMQRCGDRVRLRDASQFHREVPTPGMTNLPCEVEAMGTCTDNLAMCPATQPGDCMYVIREDLGNTCNATNACNESPNILIPTNGDEVWLYLPGEAGGLSLTFYTMDGTGLSMEYFGLDGVSNYSHTTTRGGTCGRTSWCEDLGDTRFIELTSTGGDYWITAFRFVEGCV